MRRLTALFSVSSLILGCATAPERADLVWLQAQVCEKLARCDPEPVERRLRALDPTNGAGWMGALARAYVAKDEETTDAAIAAIGRSDRTFGPRHMPKSTWRCVPRTAASRTYSGQS